MKTISMSVFDSASIDSAIAEIDAYRESIPQRTDEMLTRTVSEGYKTAADILSSHVFDGYTLGSLNIGGYGANRKYLTASSQALWFLEFGAGLKATGHPWDGIYRTGIGSYPGQTHATEESWIFPTTDPRLMLTNKKGERVPYGISHGTSTYKPFWTAYMTMKNNIVAIAKEVFGKP